MVEDLGSEEKLSKAIIRIATLQRALDGGDAEVIELVTQGEYYTRGDVLVLEYIESELSGVEGTKTSLQVEDHRIVMNREGDFTSMMEFETGKRMKGVYPTTYGILPIELLTKKIDVRRQTDPFFVQADIVYDMVVHHIFEGQNEMRITASKLDNQ